MLTWTSGACCAAEDGHDGVEMPPPHPHRSRVLGTDASVQLRVGMMGVTCPLHAHIDPVCWALTHLCS
eukprot:1138534-Pelagomonas_calceolata.AAC.8